MSSYRTPFSTYNGEKLKIGVFGASHGKEIGVIVEGLKGGETFDIDELKAFMYRRAAKKGDFSTARTEPDEPVFISGVNGNKLNGETLIAVIENKNQKSSDYGETFRIPRPGHADYTGYVKFGKDFDFRGGGIFSGRLTAPLCVAGGIAKQILEKKGVKIHAFLESVGQVFAKSYNDIDVENFDYRNTTSDLPLLDESDFGKINAEIKRAKADGDSVGGKIGCVVLGLKKGVGGTMFNSLESDISRLIFGIPAVKGIEFGRGFALSETVGSIANDEFYYSGEEVKTKTNNNGGINGGISNGMPITFSVAVKPTPSIYKEQNSVDLILKKDVKFTVKGRHDACIAVRAVPVVEAVTALSILDKTM